MRPSRIDPDPSQDVAAYVYCLRCLWNFKRELWPEGAGCPRCSQRCALCGRRRDEHGARRPRHRFEEPTS